MILHTFRLESIAYYDCNWLNYRLHLCNYISFMVKGKIDDMLHANRSTHIHCANATWIKTNAVGRVDRFSQMSMPLDFDVKNHTFYCQKQIEFFKFHRVKWTIDKEYAEIWTLSCTTLEKLKNNHCKMEILKMSHSTSLRTCSGWCGTHANRAHIRIPYLQNWFEVVFNGVFTSTHARLYVFIALVLRELDL